MLNLSSVQRLTSDENLNNEAEDKREYKKEVYLWLWLVSGMMLISVVVDIAILIELMLTNKPLAESVWLAFGSTLFLLFSAFVLLCFLRRSSLFEWVYVLGEARRQKYASSKLTDEDCKQYFKKLERLLNSNKPYKDGRLKLGDVAKLLELNPRVLSEVVNRRCAMNFSSYLNTYRVEEVKRLLLAEPEKNITELMFDSGFVTKSTFNKEFARVCGCSPSAYRAQNLP
ncbi:helix-turn-helix domain-containing protein [Agaribacterium sp. ZY112]|uniref:helix-turn-helix domain-containing protein n=1 Tax=Agaribacterium sp. ZY112 TaxID=3233574 RepID=UPI0035261114